MTLSGPSWCYVELRCQKSNPVYFQFYNRSTQESIWFHLLGRRIFRLILTWFLLINSSVHQHGCIIPCSMFSVPVRTFQASPSLCLLMLGPPSVQERAGVGFQRRHHPPSVLQAKEWRAQPVPLLPENRDIPAHAGSALPGDPETAGATAAL